MTRFEFPDIKTSPLGAKIVATAAALPEQIVTDADIIERFHPRMTARSVGKIFGTSERRVAPDGMTDSDLATQAAASCLKKAGVEPEQLSKIIVTRFLGDRLLPMTASFVQQKLGCGAAVQAFDIVGGVHSFIEAMHSGACAADSDEAPVLIVSGGVIHRLISKSDPRTAFLFGDGAAAILLASSREPGILASYSFCNSDFIDSASAFSLREYLGAKMLETENYDSFYDLYREDGWKKAEGFILDAMGFTARTLLRTAEKTASEIDLWLITENSFRLRRAIIERLEIPEHKTLSLMSSLGNTMSAMLPLLLNEASTAKRIAKGSTVMLLSMGEGLKGGGMLIRI